MSVSPNESVASREALLRCAFALNNMGVELQRRGRYEDSWITLRDATAIVKESMYGMYGADFCTQQKVPAGLAETLQAACRRVCGSSTLNAAPMILEQTTIATKYPDLYLIRIDDVIQGQQTYLTTGFYTDDPDGLLAAIILYNFALALLFYIEDDSRNQGPHGSNGARHQRELLVVEACKIFQLALRIIENLWSVLLHVHTEQQDEDVVLTHQVLTLQLMVYKGMDASISQLSRHTGVREAIRDQMIVVEDDLEAMQQRLQSYLYPLSGRIAAASA